MELISSDFQEGGEIPRKFGYKYENEEPDLNFKNFPSETKTFVLIMDDPDAVKAVGKVWIHSLWYSWYDDAEIRVDDNGAPTAQPPIKSLWEGKNDFGEIGYGGPAPPDGRHTYIFKGYALDTKLDLAEGFSKQELEDAMKGYIIDEAKLTGTFAP